MKKLKNKKIIILLIVLLFGTSIATFFVIKNNNKNDNTNTEDKQIPINENDQDTNFVKTDEPNNTSNDKNKDKNNVTNNKNSDKKQDNTANNKNEEVTSKPADKNQSSITNSNNSQNTSTSDKTNNNENQSTTNDNKSNNNSENNNENNNENQKPSNDKDKDQPNIGDNNNKDDNESNKDVNEDKPTEDNPTIDPPVIKDDKNDIKRKEIEKRFGIKILYGDEIGSYKPKRISPIKLTDENEIANYLNSLNKELAKYPTGFFNDFNNKGMPLTIYLVKSANGIFAGFTDYEFMNNIKMTIVTDYSFEYTLHHEMMHYIDCYLNIVMYPNTPYTDYEKLNPIGFSYGNAKESEIYNMGNNTRGAYFISRYGSTHVSEDRAEVFKFMMARVYAPPGCFEAGETLNKKAKVISNQIKTYFPSVNSTANWDKFIK